MVIIERSKSNRAMCKTCHNNIEKDIIKIGTAYKNEGYTNVDWHHEECFWEKRAATYYTRKGKKINILLKLEQFSGQQNLDRDGRESLIAQILESNLKRGTKEALTKAGIEVSNKSVTQTKSETKKQKKSPIKVEDEDQDEDSEKDQDEEVVVKFKKSNKRIKKNPPNEITESETTGLEKVEETIELPKTRGRKRKVQ